MSEVIGASSERSGTCAALALALAGALHRARRAVASCAHRRACAYASRMYTSFFGLGEKPFAITPDPRYLFMSERHAEALAHLLYGINEAGGFIQLTGEVGTGKTTVVRSLLERMPGHADVAVILNPQLTPLQFVLTICEELGIFVRDEDAASIKDLVDILNKRLLEAHAKGRRVVVIVDEAQNLVAGNARAGAPADESRNRLAEAAADHPDRPARAARGARRASSCGSSRSALPAAITSIRCRRAETAAYVNHRLQGRRRQRRDLHGGGAARSASAERRHSAHHQCHLRSRAARRVHAGTASHRPVAGARSARAKSMAARSVRRG